MVCLVHGRSRHIVYLGLDLIEVSKMCEITNKNFEEKCPEIIESIRSAAFLSVDCEFSGLFDSEPRISLFDSVKEVFEKKQKSLRDYHIVEFGLSIFNFDRNINTFNVSTYNFYLFPFIYHEEVTKFTWQLQSVNFLCRYKFDFNKVFYDGISYLNKTEEGYILDMINDGTISDLFNNEDFQDYYCKIFKWASTATEGEEQLIELEGKQLAMIYVLQFEIRKSIANVWATIQNKNAIKVKKISSPEKLMLLSDKKEEADLKRKIFSSILGFSKIIQEIERVQKPIIGHNFLIDLILIYHQFYNRAPVSYNDFKHNIHKIFPCVFDTKVVSIGLQVKLSKEECWPNSSLRELYSYFRFGNGAKKIILSPKISSRENYSELENFHDAGFDSFCTGYCFVKIAYMILLWDENKKKFSQNTVSKTVTSLLAAVKNLSNYLYIARSEVKWIALNGPDPKRTPPLLLLIQLKGNQKPCLLEISEKLSKYNSVDFKLLDRYSGVIAVNNGRDAKEIRSYFETKNEFTITDYSFLKHSFWGKTIVRSFFVSAAVGLIITSKVLRLPKFVRLT